MSFNVTEAQRQALRERLNILILLALGTFALLILRFGLLQVVQYQDWTDFADNKQVRPNRVPPMRGDLYDRNQNVLAWSEVGFDVSVIPADVTDDAISRLASILYITPQTIKDRIQKNRSWSPFWPALVIENIDQEDKLPRVWVNSIEMPGVVIEERPVRRYNNDSILVSHLIGYLGEINADELADPDNRGFKMGDWIGKSGLEKSLERQLRGRFGMEYKLQDARGREVTPESAPPDLRARDEYQERIKEIKAMETPMAPGHSVLLTIDIRLQRIASQRMELARLGGPDEDLRGSVVVMDVKTGELLCLLSVPAYDPALFISRISPETWKILNDPESKPMMNRPLQGQYPPASAFKIVVAAGALEEGLVPTEKTFNCDGVFTIGKVNFRCWNKYGHGRIDLHNALVQSCDVYFYRLADSVMTVDYIDKWARNFGLGQPVLGGLLYEETGLIPNPEWKMRTRNKSWYPGETIGMSIGQGYTLVTPLQAVLIPAAVANNGRLMQPQLIHHYKDVRGLELTKFQPKTMAQVFSPATARFIAQAMEGVVNDPKGTAYKYCRSDRIAIAGKTGTAELGFISKKYRGVPVEQIPYKFRDHAWFIGYAPAEDPQIAIAVFVEHGGSGGASAGPVAKGIIEDYFFNLEANAVAPVPP